MFSKKDVQRAEQLCEMVGRAHDILNQVEQFHTMRSVARSIDEVGARLDSQCEQSHNGLTKVGETLQTFSEESEAQEINRFRL